MKNEKTKLNIPKNPILKNIGFISLFNANVIIKGAKVLPYKIDSKLLLKKYILIYLIINFIHI